MKKLLKPVEWLVVLTVWLWVVLILWPAIKRGMVHGK